MPWGGGPRGEPGGLRRLLPFKRAAPARAPLPERGGAWESLCLLLAKRPAGGAGGRAGAAALPFCFRAAAGAVRSAQRSGSGARLPVPGRPEEGGSEGRTPARRWGRPAGAEGGAGARPRRRSADSGAAGAGGGGGGEAAQSRSRPASMGRLAPRPLLLALLALGECARGSARRGGTVGAPGARRGAAAARGLGAEGAGATPGRPDRGTRAARPGGGGRRGVPGARRGSGPARGGQPPLRRAGPRPPHVRGGVARGRLPPALSTCWPPGAGLTLSCRPGRCPRSPASVPSLGAEICALDLPPRGRDPPTRSSHTSPG